MLLILAQSSNKLEASMSLPGMQKKKKKLMRKEKNLKEKKSELHNKTDKN